MEGQIAGRDNWAEAAFWAGYSSLISDFWPLNTSLWVEETYKRGARPIGTSTYFFLQRWICAQFTSGSAVTNTESESRQSCQIIAPPAARYEIIARRVFDCSLDRQLGLKADKTRANSVDYLPPKLLSAQCA